MSAKPALIETVQKLYAAFGRGEIATVLAGLSEDVKWNLNVDPALPGAAAIPLFRRFFGRADVGNFFTGLARDLEFHVFDPHGFAVGVREVIAEVTIETTVRATGCRLRLESLHQFTFNEAGLVTRFHEFSDTLAIATAWGKVRAA